MRQKTFRRARFGRVPKGAPLPPYPEGQTKYWVKTSDYNYQFADLKKTVLDLSRLVEQFQKDNER